jgi:hypothetical protein
MILDAAIAMMRKQKKIADQMEVSGSVKIKKMRRRNDLVRRCVEKRRDSTWEGSHRCCDMEE